MGMVLDKMSGFGLEGHRCGRHNARPSIRTTVSSSQCIDPDGYEHHASCTIVCIGKWHVRLPHIEASHCKKRDILQYLFKSIPVS